MLTGAPCQAYPLLPGDEAERARAWADDGGVGGGGGGSSGGDSDSTDELWAKVCRDKPASYGSVCRNNDRQNAMLKAKVKFHRWRVSYGVRV